MNARGFTLIELLVAVAILATLSALAYGSLNTLIAQYRDADDEVERIARVQRTMMMLSHDLMQIQPRGVREEFHGDPVPAVRAGVDHEHALELTRGGWSNPGRQRRATLQRVAWRYNDDERRIERWHWRLLDRAQQQEALVTPLVGDVERFEWRFLDDSDEWRDAWPPAATQQADDLLPRAAEMTITFTNGDEIRRVFSIRAR